MLQLKSANTFHTIVHWRFKKTVSGDRLFIRIKNNGHLLLRHTYAKFYQKLYVNYNFGIMTHPCYDIWLFSVQLYIQRIWIWTFLYNRLILVRSRARTLHVSSRGNMSLYTHTDSESTSLYSSMSPDFYFFCSFRLKWQNTACEKKIFVILQVVFIGCKKFFVFCFLDV